MAKFISRSYVNRGVNFSRVFSLPEIPGAGYGFDCDASGFVDTEALNSVARENYRACLGGIVEGRKVVDMGVERRPYSYIVPAVVLCGCGGAVTLDHDAAPCPRCGTEYNLCGQALNRNWRREVYQETGELCNW